MQAAELAEERRALAARYQGALDEARSRGCARAVRYFERAAGATKAVIARSLLEVDRLASSPRQLYASYYQLLDAEVKLPDDDRFDPLRRKADETLFPGYKERIRIAALSCDGAGLPGYGECSLELREDRIAHRASVFEGNSALLLARWGYNVPAGCRAPWSQRALLCVAKLARRLMPHTTKADFGAILLSAGKTREDDDFIEVHVFGALSLRSFDRVVYSRPKKTSRKQARAIAADLRARLVDAGLGLEER